ncbi:DUF960 domain-containing protein [Streptococcus sp. DD12]|uniref:DUF960 domain-containing protein n=1 Tax=Streptococcus sp. DD12 TaxID=1777880 RepID=UPI00079A6E48|nr:DUF960 domain-containing protein [Streptococcus sp. DD12]KXT76469.1 hypothetical protein STRDD12_00548 [Streptococcus sp. DD12]
MAFSHSKGRYASFGVVSSVDPKIIDTIWDILDNYLKGVFPLDDQLRVDFQNREDKLTLLISQQCRKTAIAFDYDYPFDPYAPSRLLIVDEAGDETLILPYELKL